MEAEQHSSQSASGAGDSCGHDAHRDAVVVVASAGGAIRGRVRMSPSRPVLYLVACACPPTLHIKTMIVAAQQRGWDTCLILTPSARRWLAEELDQLSALTGHPVRWEYKLPQEPDVLPPADVIVVAPATFNTINRWAAGISDTLALGLVTEAIGKQLPLLALPFLNSWQAAHPAFNRSVRFLRDAGVNVLIDDDDYTPHTTLDGKVANFSWHVVLNALPGELPDRND